jgi:hypothetical protein
MDLKVFGSEFRSFSVPTCVCVCVCVCVGVCVVVVVVVVSSVKLIGAFFKLFLKRERSKFSTT